MSAKANLTADQIRLIVRLRQQNLPIAEIGRQLGVSESVVSSYSVDRSHDPATDKIVPLLRQGMRQSEIARQTGISESIVSRTAKLYHAGVIANGNGAAPVVPVVARSATKPVAKPTTPNGLGTQKTAILKGLAELGEVDENRLLVPLVQNGGHSIQHLLHDLRRQGYVRFKINRVGRQQKHFAIHLTDKGEALARREGWLNTAPKPEGSAVFMGSPVDVEVLPSGRVVVSPRETTDEAEREFFRNRAAGDLLPGEPTSNAYQARATRRPVRPDGEPIPVDNLNGVPSVAPGGPVEVIKPEPEPEEEVTSPLSPESRQFPLIEAVAQTELQTEPQTEIEAVAEAADEPKVEVLRNGFPFLAELRNRRSKAERRAHLIEQAAELSDDPDELTAMIELAEATRHVDFTPLEREYLLYAAER